MTIYRSTRDYDVVRAEKPGDIAIAEHYGSLAVARANNSRAVARANNSRAVARANNSLAEAWANNSTAIQHHTTNVLANSDGYTLLQLANGRIAAGCRNFTRRQALEHWNREDDRACLFTLAILMCTEGK